MAYRQICLEMSWGFVVIALTIPRIKRLIAERRADREEDAE